MRRLDGKFHIERDQIIKTSTGEVIPEDEPVFLLRGRDRLALATLEYYRTLCMIDGCNDFQIDGLDGPISRFKDYASQPGQTKQPGITRGAPWDSSEGEG